MEATLTLTVNLGNLKLGFVAFRMSISPFRNLFPSADFSSLDHQYARICCSENVLLLRRGASSSVASDPMAITRVSTTCGEVCSEKSSSACGSIEVTVKWRGMGDPVANMSYADVLNEWIANSLIDVNLQE